MQAQLRLDMLLKRARLRSRSLSRDVRNLSLTVLVCSAAYAIVATSFAPVSWAYSALISWLIFASVKGWGRLDDWDKRLMMWGLFSILFFMQYLKDDRSFTSWSSVYYFCGPNFQFCTWRFTWNAQGWRKAATLWNFILSTAIALQKVTIEIGLGGLLPGEEAVTRESFISVGWRLVPFWLNRWESNFGAECSSILFELPHFALELLVVLPLVQIVCGRLRIIGNPHIQAARGRPPAADAFMAPNAMRCTWEHAPAQRQLIPRLKANKRIMAMIALVMSVAAFNALVVPLALEDTTSRDERSDIILEFAPELKALLDAGRAAEFARLRYNDDGSSNSEENDTITSIYGEVAAIKNHAALAVLDKFKSDLKMPLKKGSSVADILLVPEYWLPELAAKNLTVVDFSKLRTLLLGLELNDQDDRQLSDYIPTDMNSMQFRFMYNKLQSAGKSTNFARLYASMNKHAGELERMRDPHHRSLVPLVEISLCIMRLSCERWFAVVPVFLGYLLFRDPPPPARRMIRRIAFMAHFFERAILYSFPAVCWLYGAGAVFSSFASIVFWSGPLMRLTEFMRSSTTDIMPRNWHPATEEEKERMGGNCAICWAEIDAQVLGGGNNSTSTDIQQPNEVTGGVDNHQHHNQAPHASAMGLPCGHAYHRQCLLDWLKACYGQGRTPTCPMCQAAVALQVRYKLPLGNNNNNNQAAAGDGGAGNNAQEPREQGAGGNVDNQPVNDDNDQQQAGLVHGGINNNREQQRVIPGLDMLVRELEEDFRPRMNAPIGGGMGMMGRPDFPEIPERLIDEADEWELRRIIEERGLPPDFGLDMVDDGGGENDEQQPEEPGEFEPSAPELEQATDSTLFNINNAAGSGTGNSTVAVQNDEIWTGGGEGPSTSSLAVNDSNTHGDGQQQQLDRRNGSVRRWLSKRQQQR